MFQLQLSWRRGPDMPFGMSANIQSVVVEGTVYVGGGGADWVSDKYLVLAYDISTGKWATLQSYRAWIFTMIAINNQLVLVGGRDREHHGKIKVLGVWDADIEQWTHPYPEMHTARSSCSAVVYNEWLVVAGGFTSGGIALSSVEIMNIESKQWYAGTPTCAPWYLMRSAIVGDECFFMGGFTDGENGASPTPTSKMYSVSLPNLISRLETGERDGKIWKDISGPQITHSTPLSISGSLLAVGGKNNDRKTLTAIHLYQPDTGEWVKVGDLPTPRYWCTCALLNPSREILVAGGYYGTYLNTMDISKF